MARKKFKKIYRYSCTLTGEEFKVTAESKNPDDLMSVKAYYEMNPEKDDRPEHIKIQLEQEQQ
ncbi:MAG: hypothetical protein ACJAT2_002806 [Bacteriovoracaceae bacterium]